MLLFYPEYLHRNTNTVQGFGLSANIVQVITDSGKMHVMRFLEQLISDSKQRQIVEQLRLFAKKIKHVCVRIIQWFDRLIDTLAAHPLLDKIEDLYKRLRQKRLEAQQIIKQAPWFHKFQLYVQLTRLDKPIGILLLLWPTLIALWIAAAGWPDFSVLVVFTLGVILMRSAGCAINDYADRDIDRKVKRTKERPLTSGKITEKETLMVFVALSLTAFILVLFMNKLTIWMSVGGVLLAVSYPFMKRYHYLPQVHLGAAFAGP